LLDNSVANYRAIRPATELEENMGRKIAGLVGAMATLGAFNAAEAAPIPSPAPIDVLRANSFADLLEPIPNAAALLQAVDESRPVSSADENVQLAQFYVQHHHHHHHHSQYREYAPRIVVVPPRYRRPHHHHHHHHSSYRRDY
jgi:ABC-type nickel/cobalt efflux system permease component RcnA